ncbi:outer membrane biogenesis protein BamB [Maioricimonas rarisocia]|uniref:Outer membrane biogenesis protein BamB n=1 Tax=Maioricimonas rarisocia TaxID=2528026 RepID=A0A517ZGF0_9PLAN|nr:PQQ-binding-like beta-propeller repeat protein [Maioricimonas rarisocia]QDU41544.1 outer membrane biogenesis protein BamB [Maioricimonas rarisocia]
MSSAPETSPQDAPTDSTESSTPPRKSRLATVATRILLGWLLFVLVGQTFIWGFWDPPMGMSLQLLVTYGMVVVTTALALTWLAFFAPLSRKARAAIVIPCLLLIGAFAGSVRDIEWTGDMRLIWHFKWQKPQQQKLAEYLETTETTRPVAADVEIPEVTPEDMAEYRGPRRDGVVTGPELTTDWSADPPEEIWSHPCGEGYSSFAVLGDFAITLEQRGEDEVVVCYDAATGDTRWTHAYPASFDEAMGGPGPRATPTIDNGQVFSVGAEGDLVCLDLLTGQPAWHVNILEANNLPNLEWAISGSALVLGERVIVNAGGPEGNGLIAYDRNSGDVIWKAAGLKELPEEGADRNWAGYSSPMLVSLDGVEQILSFEGHGLRSYDPKTGDDLWFYPFHSGGGDPGVNVAQPTVLEGDRVFITASYGRGCAMLKVSRAEDDWKTETLWDNKFMRCKFTSPVLYEGNLYGLDEGILVCLDGETGKRKWKRGRYGHGQVLLTNGQLVLLSEDGEIVLVEASPDGHNELGRQKVLEGSKTWNPPALVRGRLYLRNHLEAACYDLRADASTSVETASVDSTPRSE